MCFPTEKEINTILYINIMKYINVIINNLNIINNAVYEEFETTRFSNDYSLKTISAIISNMFKYSKILFSKILYFHIWIAV